MIEILAHINRDGERLIVVFYPRENMNYGSDFDEDFGDIEVVADLPYVWRTEGQYIDRSEDCVEWEIGANC